jgi:hypothetical protein
VIILEEGRKVVLRKYILPSKAGLAVRRRPLPTPSPEPTLASGKDAKKRVQFVERGKPVLFAMFSHPRERSVVPIALSIARGSGSRLVAMRILGPRSKVSVKEDLEDYIRTSAADAGIPCTFVDVKTYTEPIASHELVSGIRDAIDESGADTIVAYARKSALFGRFYSAEFLRWTAEFPDKRILLVVEGRRADDRLGHPYRILLPVFQEFKLAPFKIAAVLTESKIIPDIDVVLFKVIEIPSIVPLYPTYQAKSLVDEKEELSFVRTHRLRKLLRNLAPEILLVRETSRDLAAFASDRKVDMIIFEGDRSRLRKGFLSKEEREVVKRVQCNVVILLPNEKSSRGDNDNGSHPKENKGRPNKA